MTLAMVMTYTSNEKEFSRCPCFERLDSFTPVV